MKTLQLIVAILLWPLTIWYPIVVAIRKYLYDKGFRKTEHADGAIIGIGNLRMGGTGKTPHTEYLIRLFQSEHFQILNSATRIALLSRGYKRLTKGFILADENSNAEQIGDEPLMMKRKFPSITVAVCENRIEGVKKLQALPQSPDVILLDDSFQHRKFSPAVNFLVTEYDDLFCDDHILPFGNLREFRTGSVRAEYIIVSKCPPMLSKQRQEEIKKKLITTANQQVFFSYIDYSNPVPLFTDDTQPGTDNHPFSISKLTLSDSKLLLVTGIAHPEPFKRHLERHCSVSHLSFPDHHKFSKLDCELIVQKFKNLKAANKAIFTTEKDAMRILDCPHRHLFDGIPFFYVPIEVKFFHQNDFDNHILDFFHNFAIRK